MSEIQITFPNGNIKKYPKNITGFDVAKSISISLAKASIAIKINDNLQDLSFNINQDAKIEIVTNKNPESLEIIRHDAAHMMAKAVKELL